MGRRSDRRGMTSWRAAVTTLICLILGGPATAFAGSALPTRSAASVDGVNSARPDTAEVTLATSSAIAFIRNSTLGTTSPDGSGAAPLLATVGNNDAAPSYSANGTKIAFETARFSGGSPDIAVVNADGTGLVKVVQNAREPTWSPDGTKIAYVANRDGLIGSIYVANADGTNETRVTNAFPASDDQPAWSPDGTRIAFWTNQGAIGLRIGIVNADGTGRTLFDPAGANWRAPAWSPDATRIVAVRSDPIAVDTALFVLNADGTGPTRLTNGALADDHPAWSPDGQRIAFDRNVSGHLQLFVMHVNGTVQTKISSNATSDSAPTWRPASSTAPPPSSRIAFVRTFEIWTMNADGTDAKAVVTQPNGDSGPSLSPDGKKIAFTTGPSNIAIVNIDGTGLTTILLNAKQPTWSPDGTKIAYVALRDGLIRSVYVANADGTNETRPTNAYPYYDDEPAWSPDGTRIAFSTTEGDGRVGVVNADGTGRTMLSPQFVTWRSPAWSPDGTRIAARQHDPNAASELAIFAMNADGTNVTRLTGGSNDDHPSWSPDGLRIAFDRTVSTAQIMVMNADGTAQTNISNSATADSAPSWGIVPIAAQATSTTLVASANPAVFGQVVTLAAAVTAATRTTTGSVRFSEGTTTLATVALASGVAMTTLTPSVGTHTSVATYEGITGFAPSAADPLALTINRASTELAVKAAPDPASDGAPVTLRASVSVVDPGAGIPTGSVTFFDGATALGSSVLEARLATIEVVLSTGTHTITAQYAGDRDFEGSTAAAVTLTVQPSAVVVAVTETVAVSDQPAVLPAAVITVSEIVGVSDAVAVLPPAQISIGESVTVTDAAAVLPSVIVSVSETIALSDAPTIGNTSVGSLVHVILHAFNTDSAASLTFSTVTSSGNTTLTASLTGLPAPTGFDPATPLRYFDISTTATYAGPITVCIDVTPLTFVGSPHLFHLENGVWADHTVSFDPLLHEVCAIVSSLSPFLVAYDATPPEARIEFDAETRDLAVFGTDAGSGTSAAPVVPTVGVGPGRERRTYRVVDNAGNTLEIVIRVERDGHEVHATVIALRYNGGESLAPPRSDLAFEWALAADATLRSLEQRIATGVGPDRQEVDARFDARSDTTEIKVKGSAGEHRISRPGLALIRLGTDRGVLIAQVPKLAAATASPQLVE